MKKLYALINILRWRRCPTGRRWIAHRLSPIAYCLLLLAFILEPCTLNLADAQTYTLTGNICASVDCQCDTLGNCTQTFPAGTSVTLIPKADTGYVFVGWIGEGLSGTKPASLVMSQDRRVVAIFESYVYRNLYVISYGTGSGKVTSTPAGIDGIFTQKQFQDNSKVVLTAVPDADSTFTGWKLSVGTCSGTGTCTITMTTSKIVTANFKKK